MINELKINICLTLDIDSGMNQKDLDQYIKDNLIIKSHPFIDLVSIDILKKLKEPNY